MTVGLQNWAAILPPTLAAVGLNLLFALPYRFLTNLRAYCPPESAHASPGVKRVKPRHSKKSDDVDLGGAESLLLVPLQPSFIKDRPLFSLLEALTGIALAAIFSFVITEALVRQLGWSITGMPLLLALVGCVGCALAVMAQADLLSSYTSGEDKVYACIFGFISFCAAVAVQLLQPGSLLAWDLQAAAGAVGPLVTAVAKQRSPSMAAWPVELALPPSVLQLLLSALVGCVSTLLFAPCLRFARSYWLLHSAPDWAADYITCGALGRLLLNMQLVLPLVTCLLWVRPLGLDLWQLPAQQVSFAQVSALLLLAAVILLNVRNLAQRYLDTALVAWHQLKHGGIGAAGKKADKAAIAMVIKANCQVALLLVGKAAVQIVAPAVLFLGLALARLFSLLHPGLLAEVADVNELIDSATGFLACWAAGSCFLLYAGCIWMFKTGTLRAA